MYVYRGLVTTPTKRVFYAAWILLILAFAALHALHLSADFPNGSPWFSDWAKYTDEGWYGNAALRAHLFGHWYQPGDFNPAVALPLWPALEWLVFCFTGVSLTAARGLAVGCFFLNLLLSYLLLRVGGRRWTGLLAVTLLVTSPFLYCFSRLAILEPLLSTLTLAALNLAVRLGRWRRPLWAATGVGLLFALMMFTKTTAIFLLPALLWALLWPLRRQPRLAGRCAAALAATSAGVYGAWLALVARHGLLADYRYLFFINTYPKPRQLTWPIASFWWSFHGCLWGGHVLVPLAGLLALGAALAWGRASQARVWHTWGRSLWLDPVFGAAILAVAGYILFMTYQDHPQPRYFAVVALFCFLSVARAAGELLEQPGATRRLGHAAIALAVLAAAVDGIWILNFATHPQYTFLNAARQLTRYIDEHPNGNRLLVSISGDQITLATHLPTLCDDFGTQELPAKLAAYQPGWYAAWNDLDPGTLEDLHIRYSLEQVAAFPAFDDPERNLLVLFKLHPLPGGQLRDISRQNLRDVLPGDSIHIPVE